MSNIYIKDTVQLKTGDGSVVIGQVDFNAMGDVCVRNQHGFPVSIHKDSELQLIEAGEFHKVGKPIEELLWVIPTPIPTSGNIGGACTVSVLVEQRYD